MESILIKPSTNAKRPYKLPIFNMRKIDEIMLKNNISHVQTSTDSTALYMPCMQTTPKHWHDFDFSFQRDWTKRYLIRAGYHMFITIPGPVCGTYHCFARTPKQLERALETWKTDCLEEWERLHLPKTARSFKKSD